MWLDRGSNPGSFADRANTLPLSYWATRSYHQQFSTWQLPRLHTSPNFVWGNPRISYILLWRTYRLNHLSAVGFYVEAISNRWKIVARPGLEPRVFHWPCEHSTTELPSQTVISPTILHLTATPVTYFLLEKVIRRAQMPVDCLRVSKLVTLGYPHRYL